MAKNILSKNADTLKKPGAAAEVSTTCPTWADRVKGVNTSAAAAPPPHAATPRPRPPISESKQQGGCKGEFEDSSGGGGGGGGSDDGCGWETVSRGRVRSAGAAYGRGRRKSGRNAFSSRPEEEREEVDVGGEGGRKTSSESDGSKSGRGESSVQPNGRKSGSECDDLSPLSSSPSKPSGNQAASITIEDIGTPPKPQEEGVGDVAGADAGLAGMQPDPSMEQFALEGDSGQEEKFDVKGQQQNRTERADDDDNDDVCCVCVCARFFGYRLSFPCSSFIPCRTLGAGMMLWLCTMVCGMFATTLFPLSLPLHLSALHLQPQQHTGQRNRGQTGAIPPQEDSMKCPGHLDMPSTSTSGYLPPPGRGEYGKKEM